MYRAVALNALQNGGLALTSEAELEALARDSKIELQPAPPSLHDPAIHNRVLLDGVDVTQSIRTNEVAQAASRVATVAGVRKIMVAAQQRMGAGGGVVMEGRDIGTVVFPNAELKIFLEATAEARGERRLKEHLEKEESFSLEQVMDEVRERDKRDTERNVSPLVRAKDAVLIDNTAMDVEETARAIILLAEERERQQTASAGGTV
jgi:cytidylate kinase